MPCKVVVTYLPHVSLTFLEMKEDLARFHNEDKRCIETLCFLVCNFQSTICSVSVRMWHFGKTTTWKMEVQSVYIYIEGITNADNKSENLLGNVSAFA